MAGRAPKNAASGAPPPPRGPRPRRARRTILFGSLALLLLCALTVVAVRLSRRVGERNSARPLVEASGPGHGAGGGAQTAAPEVDSRIFQVTEATGRVEAQRDGKWTLVVSGDVLTQDDLVRTGVGRAILRRGATEVELRDRVEIRLENISRAGTSLDLRRGRVVAHVGRSGGSVAITAARTRTANEGDAPARFVVTADERGRVSVATTEGLVRFEAAGRAVKVAAGSSARAAPGQQPSDPEKISEDIFLTVAWPTGERREEKVPVSGQTDPGATVRVNGKQAEVDGTGHFVAAVPVRVGANPIEVEAEDVSGRIKRDRAEVHKISTKPPGLAPVPTELWHK
ncbi:MAG: hypothetical protein ABJA82_10835 [Myxococcales bacterium]